MKLKMIVMFVDTDHAADLEQMFEECDVPGYSRIPNVMGKGATGKKSGNRAFPGTSTMFVVAVDESCRGKMIDKLRALRDQRGPEEGLKVFAMDTEELL